MQPRPDINHDLLQPSLGLQRAPAQAPYSTQMLFLAAFFGGPLAALGGFALNLHRLGRLRRDAGWALAGLVLTLGCLVAYFGTPGAPLRGWFQAQIGSDLLAERLLALALFGLGALRHRREQAACQLMGIARPNGIVHGIVLIVIGNLLDRLLQEMLR